MPFASKMGLPSIVPIAVSSALFGAVHMLNGESLEQTLPQVAYNAGFGYRLGVIHETHGLAAAIAAHMVNNTVVLARYLYNNP